MPLDPRDSSSAPAPGAAPAGVPTMGGGRYALESKIAEGGMAGVYRARDTRLGVWRAIKVLLPEFAERKSLRTRFVNEAHTMAQLDHRNLVRVYDVGTDGPLPYIVMHLAEGGTLIEWCETWGAMPARLATRVMSQVARGVQAAHDAGVVHRDIKPHNVLIDADGTCKVTDFGIAQIAAADGMTRTGSTMGTIGYMAPEQRSDAKAVDVRADVYSLGAVLYKLLTNTVVTDLFLVEHEPEFLRGIPEPLHEVLLRACFHDRERRYPDAASMGRALDEILELLPADPDDTPALPLPPSDASMDGPPGPGQFSEIASMLEGLVPLEPSETSAVADTSPVMPYTMSRPDRHSPRPAHPRYFDQDDSGVDGTVDELDVPRPPATTVSEPGADPVVEIEHEEPSSSPLLRVLALTAIGAWVLLASLGAVGAWETRGRAQVEGVQRQVLYRVVTQEQGTLAELARHGADPRELERVASLYQEFETASTERERLAAAAAYGAAIDSLMPVDEPSLVRTTNVQAAWSDWRDAREGWVDSATSAGGRLAVGLGLAPAP